MNDRKNIIAMPDRERIREEAGDWVARLDTRALTDDEEAAFKAWRAQSAAHEEEFARVEGAWADCDLLDALNYIDHEEEQGARRLFTPALRRMPVFMSMAASVSLLVCAIAVYAFVITRGALQESAFRTALGERQTVTLDDGSVIELNTDTQIEIDFTRTERTVRLVRGEAHFAVEKDRSRPFSVHAGEEVVRAVGTAFTVRLKEERAVEVTVSEGRVALFSAEPVDAGSGPPESEAEPRSAVEVIAGESAIVKDLKLESLEELATSELERRMSWRRGILVFSGEPLSEAVAEVSRYTDFRIDIGDPALGDIQVGGYFQAGEVDSFLGALESAFGVRIEQISDQHVRLVAKDA